MIPFSKYLSHSAKVTPTAGIQRRVQASSSEGAGGWGHWHVLPVEKTGQSYSGVSVSLELDS